MPKVVLVNEPHPKAKTGVIIGLFTTCIHLLLKHSPAHPCINSEIRVHFGPKGPHVRFGGNCNIGFDVDLTAQNDCWDQHLYQFAHEALHICAMNNVPRHPNQWLEEAFAETASLWSLRTMADLEQNGPCANLFAGAGIPLSRAFREYALKYINSPHREWGEPTLQNWFRIHSVDLRSNPYERDLNGTLTNRLLPMFEKTPSNWASIQFLNTLPCTTGKDSLQEYLANWRKAAPGVFNELISNIESLLIPI